jgi:DNA-binding response OmpR family regulator
MARILLIEDNERLRMAVLRELRTAQPPVPVIAMSGGGMGSGEDYLAMATVLGAATVLLKPFPPAVLIAAIEELLPDGERNWPATAACRHSSRCRPMSHRDRHIAV